jgi:hypothetical protein
VPNLGLSTAEMLEALDAFEEHGTQAGAARALNMNRLTYINRLQQAQNIGRERLMKRLQYEETDPAIADSMKAVGTNLVPKLAWAKTKSEDGTSYSVLLKPQEMPEETLDRIREAFEGMAAAPVVPAPAYVESDLLTIYPIADAHVGMMAWGKETGEDYDTNLAADRIKEWVGRCVASSPASETAVILDVGDLTHADDQTNQTPASKHPLDVDTRHYRTLEVVIAALSQTIETALGKHKHVHVRILPGNHNRTSFMAVMFALAERYRNEPRVSVHKNPSEFFVMEWGKVMLCAHHGDKSKADRLVHFMADEFAEIWGRTRHRFLWTGHLHHHKSQDIGGCKWEQLRALTARDAYAASHAYTARSQMQAVTYHRDRGEIQRVSVGL